MPLLVYNRSDKTSLFYYPLKGDKKERCSECEQTNDPNPGYSFRHNMNNMKPTIFSKILGVVPIHLNHDYDEFLILFNISNRLKYCLTTRTEVCHNFDIEFNQRFFSI